MLTASGVSLAAASPLALAACGDADEDEETSPAREGELLGAVLAQQLGVLDAIAPATGNAPTELEPSFERLRAERERSSRELEREIADLGASAGDEPEALAGGESPTEGLARQLEVAIAVSLEAIGELTPARRAPVHRAISEDAAALAAIRGTLGEAVAPDPFAMGPPARGRS